jgi:hypothetical protein
MSWSKMSAENPNLGLFRTSVYSVRIGSETYISKVRAITSTSATALALIVANEVVEIVTGVCVFAGVDQGIDPFPHGVRHRDVQSGHPSILLSEK